MDISESHAADRSPRISVEKEKAKDAAQGEEVIIMEGAKVRASDPRLIGVSETQEGSG